MLKILSHHTKQQRSFHTQSVLYHRHHKQQHYDILQVHRHSDKKAIKAQYYRLSKRYHPDLNPSDKEAHEKFLQVNDAYAVLGNEATRRQYDNELDRISPSSTSTSTAGSGFSNNMRQPSSMYYGASRPGYTGPSTAWRAKAKQPRNTGSASARAQANQQYQQSSSHFNHHEHYAKHYQAEELRRRERVMNAAKRRKEAGLFGDDDVDSGGNGSGNTNDRRLNVWSRLWRLSVVLVGISYVTRLLFEYDEDQKNKKKKDRNGFLVD